jgi:hypothetical protein
LWSAAFGLGAGVVGAAIYYAVLTLAHLEVGLIAVLIGYMVGYAVRKGASGRGGRRFQVLAVALTYGSIAMAYVPALMGGSEGRRASQAETAEPSRNSGLSTPVSGDRAPNPARQLFGLVILLAGLLALPVIIVVNTLPSGLLTAIIIGVGLRQAWMMTGATHVRTLGPYRVGAGPNPEAA